MSHFHFQKVDPADGDLMQQIYRLRFQVYVEECKFVDKSLYPDELEQDEYDTQAAHFAGINSFGEVVGCLRLILPGESPLPIRSHCPDVDWSTIEDYQNAAEISRMVIGKRLRNRALANSLLHHYSGNIQPVGDSFTEGFLRDTRPLVLGLFTEVAKECKSRGITRLFALMERSLWVLMRMYGLRIRCIGQDVDVFGIVRPHTCHLDDFKKPLQKFAPSDPFLTSQ